jgi:hypothetical protein
MPARTLPNIGLQGFFALGEDGWKDEMDLNLLKLSVLVQGTVIDKVSSLPGTPSNGDVYILDETAASDANSVAIRDADAWVYVTPSEGWFLYNRTADRFELFGGATWAEYAPAGSGDIPYAVPFGFTTTPSASEVLLLHVFAEAVTFGDDWVGAAGIIGTNPAASFTLDVRKNGTSIGSISVTTGGAITYSTTDTTVSFAAGDLLSIVGPSTADAAIANCAFTLKATRG